MSSKFEYHESKPNPEYLRDGIEVWTISAMMSQNKNGGDSGDFVQRAYGEDERLAFRSIYHIYSYYQFLTLIHPRTGVEAHTYLI